jgi:ABC-2 type transport system permease protein
MMIVSVVTIFCLVPAIVALAVGLGARFPDFKSENPALSATSFGGVLFMLLSFGLIALVIILRRARCIKSSWREFRARVFLLDNPVVYPVLCIRFAPLRFAVFFPMKAGEKHLLAK